jgi:hypothetical protein
MRSLSLVLAFGFGFGLGVPACGTDDGDQPPPPPDQVTWFQDVAPILSRHCMTCHQDGGIAPFSLTEYDNAKDNSELILTNVDGGVMPPFDAREEASCTPRFGWVDDPRLSQVEKDTLHAWVDQGNPLGTEAAIPPIPSSTLQDVTKTLVPTQGFASAGNRDQFFCYILDPAVTQLTWLTGLQVNPDQAEVVHHAVITEIGPGPDQDALVAAHPIGTPFDCSTMATPGQFVVHIWTPGNNPLQTAGDIAVPLVAGSKLVMQIHYHPAGVSHDPDKTSIDLRFSNTWPTRMYFVTALGNAPGAPALLPDPDDTGSPEFLVPANKPDHRERMTFTIPDLGGQTDVRLFSVNPHMHLVGTHINATITRPAARGTDPASECLANGGWNFDWQRSYLYDAPLDKLPSVAVGDRIDLECAWNNTIDNPFVQRMLSDAGLGAQPVDIKLGEQTTNEMCLEIFGLSIPAPAQPRLGDVARPFVLPQLGSSVSLQ